MEEVLEQLRALNEPVSVPLELPDDDMLLEIQEALLISLPADLYQFLLYASDVVYGRLEPVTASDPNAHTYLPEVAAQAWDAGVPRWLIPLCQASRDFYVVDAEGLVWLWEEQSERLAEQHWESVWEWVLEVWLAD